MIKTITSAAALLSSTEWIGIDKYVNYQAKAIKKSIEAHFCYIYSNKR